MCKQLCGLLFSLGASCWAPLHADDDLEFRHSTKTATINGSELSVAMNGKLFQIASPQSLRIKIVPKRADELPKRLRISLYAASKKERIGSADRDVTWTKLKTGEYDAIIRNPFPDPGNGRFAASLKEGDYFFEVTIDMNDDIAVVVRRLDFTVARLRE